MKVPEHSDPHDRNGAGDEGCDSGFILKVEPNRVLLWLIFGV